MKNEGYLHLKLNNTCNCNCNFCADSSAERLKKENSIEDIKIILSNGFDAGFDSLIISGGEPTISKNLFETIDYARLIGFNYIMLVTNGRMLAIESFMNNCLSRKIDKYQISYYASDPILFDSISGIKNTYKQVIKGLNNLSKNNCNIQFNCVITKENYLFIDKMFIQMYSFFPTGIQFGFLNPSGNSLKETFKVVPKYSDTISSLLKVVKLAKYLGYFNLQIENYPFCVLNSELREYMSEKNYPVLEKDLHLQGKIKNMNKCISCTYKNNCSGIWLNYSKIHGDSL